MANARNHKTTHPKKAARRRSALENFTVYRKRMDDADYMARRRYEYLALGGSSDAFASLPQRLSA